MGEGEVEIDLPDGKVRKVGIERLHLEQDAGKSLHDQHPTQSYIDLNRSGVALMEIVSKPDMRSADEAAAYLAQAALDRALSRHLRRQHGRRLHALRRQRLGAQAGTGPLGTRCEIKNVNSIRFVKQAIEYEARRQVELIEGGGTGRCRRRGGSIRRQGRDALACAPRKTRTTTATSPIPTCCRWS